MDVAVPRSAAVTPSERPAPITVEGLARFVPWILLALTLAVFSGALFGPRGRIVSAPDTDLATEFLYWRAFGVRAMLHGHLPLWNPSVFGGVPFFGGFQSALLYPPNWLYLLLPLDKAINVEVALHVFLMGLWTSVWAARRGLHPLACLVSGACAMFGGPFFLHVYAGHLATLDTMAWMPLTLLCVEQAFEPRPLRWTLLGMFSVAMQALAGHPQSVFITGVAAGLLAVIRLAKSRDRIRALVCIAAIFAGAVLLSAVQVFTGVQEAGESTRASGVSFAFASAFSFPPENAATWLVPGFFGDMTHARYWGRCYLWEMSLFMGVLALSLAVYGVCAGGELRRRYGVMAVMLLWIALGAHTPLLRVLYDHVPGFDKFRSHSKFIVPASLFLALLAGGGLDLLLRGARPKLAVPVALLTAAVVIGSGGVWLHGAGAAPLAWRHLTLAVASTGECYAPRSAYFDPAQLMQSRLFAAAGCLRTAALLLLAGGLIWLAKFSPRAPQALAALAVLEITAFAAGEVPTFSITAAIPAPIKAFLAAHPGDYRILQLAAAPESAAAIGAQDLWGYNPGVSSRYASFMAWTQGDDPETANMYLTFNREVPLYRMLRLRYVFLPTASGSLNVIEQPDPLPHLLLVSNWEHVDGEAGAFQAMAQRSFDPSRTVLLDSPPTPAPAPGPPGGTVRLTASDSDSLTITADTPRPAILLITDTYARGWRAVALPGSVQRHYDLLPADDVLRAVPLAAGHHRLRVEYAPSAFRIGTIVSIAAWATYLLALALTGCPAIIHGPLRRTGRRLEPPASCDSM